MDRRKFLIAASGSFAAGLALPQQVAAGTMNEMLPAGAVSSGILDALRGKKPLLKRSFRPPNYETPVEYFRHQFTPNEAFYVRWHTTVPQVALADWRLKVAGPAAQRPSEFSYTELRKRFEFVEVAAVNQCSGNRRGLFAPHVPGVQWGYGAMGNAVWRGVRLKDVLEAAGIAGNALEVVGNGADVPLLASPDFVKSLPMWKALDPDTLIAFQMNGAALPIWNGGPARLVVPGWTATYWIKSLTDLQVTDKVCDGFWMKTAYRVPKGLFGDSGFPSQDAEANAPITGIRVNSLVVGPAPGATLRHGRRVEVLGIAWDGGSGIRGVAVSLDGGQGWREAKLLRDYGRYSWRQWRFPLEPAAAGNLSMLVRATARDGSTQTDALVLNPAGYHHNVVQQVDYHVA